MDYEFESITPWNGEHDTGRDARLKLDRNFAKIKSNFEELAGRRYVTTDFFARLFAPEGEDGAEVDVNDMEAVITAVRVKFGLHTDSYISAKGNNPESGSTVAGASALADLSDVDISNPQDGQILSWNGTKWVNADAPSAGLDEAALAEYLTTNHYAKTTDIPSLEGYATQTWASGQFALKTVAINAGTGLTGGGNLSASRTLSLATVGTAGTYTKVTVDAYGRVTGHASLAAGDIPALAISKITGLQAALDAKMDAADFEELFEKVYVSGYGYAIRAKLALYTDSWMSAKGSNPDAGSAVAGASALADLSDVDISNPTNGQALVYRNGAWRNEAVASGDADTLGGLSKSSVGNRWGVIPFVEADGVMEVGRYIDFHDTDSDTSDYGLRLSMPDVSGVEVALPSQSGTLALLTSNVASATRLQTARTIALSGAVSGSTTFDGSKGVTISTTFNAQSLLTSLKTVDGSGSGLDADTLDGLHANRFFRSGLDFVTSGTDARDLHGIGIYLNATGNGSGNANWPETYGVLLNFPYNEGSYNQSVQIHVGASEKICYRIKFDSTDTDWMTLARTTDNVYSATKLQTARTLWGQSFDGTANVSGSLSSVTNITMSGYLQVGSARLMWDSATGALYVQKSDGTACGFYATGFVSAKGANDDDTPTEATVLTIADERDATIYPNTYGRGVWAFFRSNNADGLNDGGTYHTVLNIRQWANSSGGLSHQLAFTDNGGVWHRTALSETAWGEWSELSALAGLSDVSLSSPSNGQSLVYRNGIWKNETVSGGGSSSVAWDDVTGKPSWIPDTDGSGSGLDADLLDGTHKSGLFTAMTYLGSTLSLTIGGVRKSVNIETSAVIPTVSVSSTSSRNLSVNVGGSTDYVNDLYATYSTYADYLRTARTIWGQSFNGSGSVSGNLTGVGNINMSGYITMGSTQYTSSFIEMYASGGSYIDFHYDNYPGDYTLRLIEGTKGIFCIDGKVRIGSDFWTTQDYKLYVGGTAYATGGFQNGSDIRYKHVLQDLVLTVAQVAAAPSFLFRWTDGTADGVQAGTSAQYWQQVMPQVVMESAGRLSMQYDKAALAAAIATARAVTDHETRIRRLEQQLDKTPASTP